MKEILIYHSTMNGHGCDSPKTIKALRHNLRQEKALKDNYIPELTKNNHLIVQGEIVDPTETEKHFTRISAILDSERYKHLSLLSKNYSDDEKAKLSLERVECKKAIKRFITSSSDQEKDFWQNIYDRVSNESFENSKDDIDTLKSFGKIKRLNNKTKRLEQLESFNGLLNEKSRNISFTVFSKELLYKIPDTANVKVKPEHWILIQDKLNEFLYPDFESLYSVVHLDENPENPHLHNFLSGKNKTTKEFDIQDQVMINLAKHKKDYPFKNKKWSELSSEEVKIHGENYQDFVYSKMNKYLLQLGYEVKLVKKSPEQKQKESLKYLDQKKPIASREHNRQKKIQKINNKHKKVLKNQNNKIENNKNDIEELKGKKENLKSDIDILENNKTLLEKAIERLKNPKKLIEDFKKLSQSYNFFPNDNDLNEISKTTKINHEIDPELSKELADIAIQQQNTENKKNNVRKATQTRFKR